MDAKTFGKLCALFLKKISQKEIWKQKEVIHIFDNAVIEVSQQAFVDDLLRQRIDWPPALKLECREFKDLTIPEIKRRLACNEDQAADIAAKIWRVLRGE